MDLESGSHKCTINKNRGNLLKFLLGLDVPLLLAIEILNPSKKTLDQGRVGINLEGPLFLQELCGFGLLLVVSSVWNSQISFCKWGGRAKKNSLISFSRLAV